MTNSSKSQKRCPACGSSNPADAWECEMCGTSFSDAKPPKSLQQADAKPKPGSAPASVAAAQAKAKTPATSAPSSNPTKKQATKPAPHASAPASKPATTASSAPIKNAGSIKKPTPLYASKPRFGLGSLVALVFVAAFGIAAIVFGMNALQDNAPAAPAQPAAFTLDVTFTAVPSPAATEEANAGTPALAAIATATMLPSEAPTEMATEAPIEAAGVAPTVAPATATFEPTLAPSPTPAGKPTATPLPTSTPAATPAPLGAGQTITYTVKGGDTCGAISKKLGVTVAQIIEQNKLDSRCFLNVGKVLTISK